MNMAKVFERLEIGFQKDLDDVRAFLRQPSISYTARELRRTAAAVKGWIEALGRDC